MTLHDLLIKIVNMEGDCARFCAYCPDKLDTAEVKECIEEAIRHEYLMNEVHDDMLKEIIKIRQAYHRDTGKEYKEETE